MQLKLYLQHFNSPLLIDETIANAGQMCVCGRVWCDYDRLEREQIGVIHELVGDYYQQQSPGETK